ncbi:hypothetical protein BDI4_1060010 [Burkholderia diffusa]|nr:hypothetical protein BDI4_1060010 [Burkholderia diffusa]
MERACRNLFVISKRLEKLFDSAP